MALPQRNSEKLRENLLALSSWLDSPSATGWFAAREAEVAALNEQIAYDAKDWETVVALRAARENTVTLSRSFEETRDTLKAALDDAVEAETKLATVSNN